LSGNVKQKVSRILAYALKLDLGTPINACISFGEMRIALPMGKTDNSHSGLLRSLHPSRRILDHNTFCCGQSEAGSRVSVAVGIRFSTGNIVAADKYFRLGQLSRGEPGPSQNSCARRNDRPFRLAELSDQFGRSPARCHVRDILRLSGFQGRGRTVWLQIRR
jgi:hypothetical protein